MKKFIIKNLIIYFLFTCLVALSATPAPAVFTPPGETGVSREDKTYAEGVVKSIAWDSSRVTKYREISLKIPRVTDPYIWSLEMDTGSYIGIGVAKKSIYFGKGGHDIVFEVNPQGTGFYLELINTVKGCVVAEETYVYKPGAGIGYVPPEERLRGAIDDRGNVIGLYDAWGNPQVSASVYSHLSLAGKYLTFPDLPESHWAHTVVAQLAALGYIKGYPDHTFKPDQEMTRAEFAVVFGDLLNDRFAGNKPGDNRFAFLDIRPDHWSYGPAYRLTGYMSYTDALKVFGKNFEPARQITRQEAAALLSAVLKNSPGLRKTGPQGTSFQDIQGAKYREAIQFCAGNNLLTGYPDGSFKPGHSITRAEISAVLVKVFNKI